MWGSGEERLSYRRRAFSMDAFHKTGAIFVTITPNDIGTLTVAAIAGKVCSESLHLQELGQLPERATRARIAGMDPVACAEYFELVCDTFIEDIIGFDIKRGLPYREGGVFGHVKAFIGVVEAQNCGNLHLHAVIFVAGLPRTVKEFASKCDDPENGSEYKESICAVVDSIVSASLPSSPITEGIPKCPSCDKTGLKPVQKIREEAYMKHSCKQKPIPTSICSNCRSSFGACEVIRAEVKRLHSSLDNIEGAKERLIPIAKDPRDMDEMTERYCLRKNEYLWPPEGEHENSEIGKLHRLRLSRLVLLTQQHSHKHVDSCFKASYSVKHGHCRYNFPRRCGVDTQIDEKLFLQIGRKHHNEYLNPFNDVMTLLFRTNHDIRFLLGGTTDALYYVLKYVTKGPAIDLGVEKALLMSFERRRRCEEQLVQNGTSLCPVKTGKARVKSMASALFKMQEVPSPLCALYLRRKNALYSSHDFAKLFLGQTISILRAEEHETNLVSSNGIFIRATQFHDYVYRPATLESLTMTDFVTSYKRTQLPQGFAKSSPKRKDNGIKASKPPRLCEFQEEHPLSHTHGLQRRKVPVIPEIIGPRFPNCDKFDSDEERETYGIMALILFFPFERNTDLTQGTGSFWESYQRFAKSEKMSETAHRTLENFQEYYISKEFAAGERLIQSEMKECYTAEDSLKSRMVESDDEELGGQNGFQDDLEYENSVGLESSLAALKGVDEMLSEKVFRISSQTESRKSIEICAGESKAEIYSICCPDFRKDVHLVENEFSANCANFHSHDVMKDYQSLSSVIDEHCATNFGGDISNSREAKVVACNRLHMAQESLTITRLIDELKKVKNADTAEKISRFHADSSGVEIERCCSEHFASINDVAKEFSLNKQQKNAFRIVCEETLLRIAGSYHALDPLGKKRKPFLMYLGGEGGTGKTRVIEAISHFCKSWNRANAVRTCAPTGIAASLVSGQTVHSLLGIRGGRLFNRRKRVPQKIIEEHLETLVVIVDEISMLSRKLLGSLDLFFRKVKECDISFGGIIVVFCGDFFQIPPVANDPVYADPKYSKRDTGVEDEVGYKVWQSVENVILLEQSMRQSDDNSFSACLRRLRRGVLTEDDLNLLNSRVLRPELYAELNTCRSKSEYVPIVVRSNELRSAINWRAVEARGRALRSKPMVCVAQARTYNGNNICIEDLDRLFHANDTETSNIAMILPLIPGMPVRITQNICIKLGIANGTQGVLEGVSFPPGTSFEEASIFGVQCTVSSSLPNVAFVRSDLFGKKLPRRYPHLPSMYSNDTLPISAVAVDDLSYRLKRRLITKQKIILRQLPFVPAYASTSYKVQGTTAAGVVAFPFFEGVCSPPPSSSLYVVLSRVRKLSSLFLLERISKEESAYFVPSEELMEEEARLETLHNRTLESNSNAKE